MVCIIYFNCSEQCYQWIKAKQHNCHDIASAILATDNPFQQMQLGQQIATSDKWKQNKILLMREILVAKFINCREYREFLDRSGSRLLIENTHHPFWGKGRNSDGSNNLGVLHCDIRSKLQGL